MLIEILDWSLALFLLYHTAITWIDTMECQSLRNSVQKVTQSSRRCTKYLMKENMIVLLPELAQCCGNSPWELFG